MIRFIREDSRSTRLHDAYRMVEQSFPPDLESCLEECEIEISGYSRLKSGNSVFDLCPACEECAKHPLQIGPACDMCKTCGGFDGYEIAECVTDCMKPRRGSRPAPGRPIGGPNKLTY